MDDPHKITLETMSRAWEGDKESRDAVEVPAPVVPESFIEVPHPREREYYRREKPHDDGED